MNQLEGFKLLQGAIASEKKISRLKIVHSGINSFRSFFEAKEARLIGNILTVFVFLKEEDKKKNRISILEFRDWETIFFG